jgi:hypothetical protein
MNSELLARLMAADPAERQWLLLESVLESLSVEVRQAVWTIAVPHWFDDRILAALCPELAAQSTEIYQELQALSFVEVFEGRGHNIHEATRSVLLDHFWNDRSDEFKLISARATEYFADDAENVAEWLYHKAVGEQIGDALVGVMEPLSNQFRRSASEVILKALEEQIATDRVEVRVTAEVAYWQKYATKIDLDSRDDQQQHHHKGNIWNISMSRLKRGSALLPTVVSFPGNRKTNSIKPPLINASYNKLHDKKISPQQNSKTRRIYSSILDTLVNVGSTFIKLYDKKTTPRQNSKTGQIYASIFVTLVSISLVLKELHNLVTIARNDGPSQSVMTSSNVSDFSAFHARMLLIEWINLEEWIFASPLDSQLLSRYTTGNFYSANIMARARIDSLLKINSYGKLSSQKINLISYSRYNSKSASAIVNITKDVTVYKDGRIQSSQTYQHTHTLIYKFEYVDGRWKISDYEEK